MTIRKATKKMFKRYLVMTDSTSITHKRCKTALAHIKSWPIDKLSRWLGFIQSEVIQLGLTTVDNERDYSRPLFHKAYKHGGYRIPRRTTV